MKKRHAFSILLILFFGWFLILKAPAGIEVEVQTLTPKMLKAVKTMERRHFKNMSDEESDIFRLERLEEELMGQTFENFPLDRRIERLKIASQKRVLSGVSIPAGLNRHFSPKRIENDSVQIVNKDDVGIIDGLLRLYAPDFFKAYRANRARHFERYSD